MRRVVLAGGAEVNPGIDLRRDPAAAVGRVGDLVPCASLGALVNDRLDTLEPDLMGVIGSLRLSFWVVAIGTVVLYGFFVVLATISPGQVAAVTVVVGALAAIFTIRNVRLAAELADRGGDPQLRRALNRIRERRGF